MPPLRRPMATTVLAVDQPSTIMTMARSTLTTTEAAYILGIDPKSFARWARALGITPLRRQRIGRSTVSVWSITDLVTASAAA